MDWCTRHCYHSWCITRRRANLPFFSFFFRIFSFYLFLFFILCERWNSSACDEYFNWIFRNNYFFVLIYQVVCLMLELWTILISLGSLTELNWLSYGKVPFPSEKCTPFVSFWIWTECWCKLEQIPSERWAPLVSILIWTKCCCK